MKIERSWLPGILCVSSVLAGLLGYLAALSFETAFPALLMTVVAGLGLGLLANALMNAAWPSSKTNMIQSSQSVVPATSVSRPESVGGLASSTPAAVASFQGREDLEQVLEHLRDNVENQKKIHALILDIASNLKTMSARGGQATNLNADLMKRAEEDGSIVAEQIGTLVSFKDAITAGTAVINDLAESSKQVGAIIESIFAIARKTNMLALNAAIEAARAGDQGRGFAVVAEEVRKLAESSTAATQKVEQFIEDLQGKTKSAIEVLKGASRIEETIPVVYRISDSFINLVPAVDEANGALKELNSIMVNNAEEVELVSSILQRSQVHSEESVEKLEKTLRGM